MIFARSVLFSVIATGSYVSALGTLGFNLGVQSGDDVCKTSSDYEDDLDTLSSYATSIKTYAVSDCDTLQILGPVAEDKGFTISLGVWPTDDTHFSEEKAALQTYLPKISKSTISEITVGSEALYRGDLTGSELATCISEVKELLADIEDKNGDSYSDIEVGFVDSWNSIVDSGAKSAIEEADFVFSNAFSYWQGQTKANATFSFFDDIMQALQTIQTIKGSTDVKFAVGETGWPTDGSSYGSAEPGVSNAEHFWTDAICAMRGWGVNTYVFEAFDESWKADADGDDNVESYWGVWDSSRSLKYKLTCDYSG